MAARQQGQKKPVNLAFLGDKEEVHVRRLRNVVTGHRARANLCSHMLPVVPGLQVVALRTARLAKLSIVRHNPIISLALAFVRTHACMHA